MHFLRSIIMPQRGPCEVEEKAFFCLFQWSVREISCGNYP
ncbi:hypothetical protein DBT_0208 [Dissulfuribacter thermophilus]|uniref:Uncharacterized protein n=1 Tax=Dissulfuribacter thermophilus TaxID=1156395 RepID=A0A1B9F9D6_9BACT|nr:hypothetical protein DBT_0208 [Dissulfuribacter thermophilus]